MSLKNRSTIVPVDLYSPETMAFSRYTQSIPVWVLVIVGVVSIILVLGYAQTAVYDGLSMGLAFRIGVWILIGLVCLLAYLKRTSTKTDEE